MADHVLLFSTTTTNDAVFSCTACGKSFGFNKQGLGQPAALQSGPVNNPVFAPPADAQKYCGPCDQAVTQTTQLEDLNKRVDALEKKVP